VFTDKYHVSVVVSGKSSLEFWHEFAEIHRLNRNFSKSGGGAMASGGELTVRVIALQ
jgi:hypothetical protein